MRVPLLILAASLALSGCKNNAMQDNSSNVDENLTAENIVSNDVTAIDAVTGDAANMAADVDMNYGSVDENLIPSSSSEPSRIKPVSPKGPPEAAASQPPETANQTTNSD